MILLPVALLLSWPFMAIAVGWIAGAKGRHGFGWFCYGMAVGPIALVHAMAINESDEHRFANGRVAKCPECAEYVQLAARRCSHCGSAFASGAAQG